MKNILLLTLALFLGQANAVNPSEVLITVYSIGISTNADCSDPKIVLGDGVTPVEYNFLNTPSLGSNSIAGGTYNCVVLKMSDVIKFKPATSTGSCTAGTQYTIDVCRAGSGNYTPLTVSGSTGSYGTNAACTGTSTVPVDDKVTLFLSTHSTNNGAGAGNTFVQPLTAGTDGYTLNGAFVVSSGQSGTFIVNFNNKIAGGNPTCDLDAPVFGFR